jgi:hypothetical protein
LLSAVGSLPVDGQVTLRPVMEDDLSWLAFLNDPAAIGPYEWHGWSDPHRLRRSWAESGLLGDDGGVLIVLHGTDRVGVVDWHGHGGKSGRSAWESDRSRPMKPLNSRLGRPAVAVVDRLSPWLIAR